jgi:nucleotide-binding universal stress UspA family protein
MAVITVGVDGSEGASTGLRWAAAEARLRGALLRVVHTWNIPTMASGTGFAVPATIELDLGHGAKVGLDKWLEDAKAELDGVEVERRIVKGHAATVLTDAATDAELLVVGSRGLDGFSELLLGSVSHECAQRAHCPVVIVRS